MLEPKLPKHRDSPSLTRQPLVKGERLVRGEVNAVISSCCFCNHIFSILTNLRNATSNESRNPMQQIARTFTSLQNAHLIYCNLHCLLTERLLCTLQGAHFKHLARKRTKKQVNPISPCSGSCWSLSSPKIETVTLMRPFHGNL